MPIGNSLSNIAGGQTSTPFQDQQAFLAALQSQQQGLGAQLQGVANGTGPNPALSQLQATTQQNIGNANANLAANRNLNPALAAKMANQNQMQGTQNANNAAATLSAQQRLGAMSGLGTLYGQQQTGALGAQGINANVGVANAANAQNATGAIGSGITSALGTAAAFGSSFLGGGAPTTGYNSGGDYATNGQGVDYQPGGSEYVGPIQPTSTSGYATGGTVDSDRATAELLEQPEDPNGPRSGVGRYLKGLGGVAFQTLNKGGKVDAILSPGEKYLTPAEAREVATGKEKATATGKTVPGKAKVPGDSLKNDIVPAKLKQGGIVIPRSKMGSAKDATAFVKAHFAKRGKLG